jgi:hypothetical protein
MFEFLKTLQLIENDIGTSVLVATKNFSPTINTLSLEELQFLRHELVERHRRFHYKTSALILDLNLRIAELIATKLLEEKNEAIEQKKIILSTTPVVQPTLSSKVAALGKFSASDIQKMIDMLKK